MRVLVIGASGMLGSAVYRSFSERTGFLVFGTVRSSNSELEETATARQLVGIDVLVEEHLHIAFETAQPEVVINAAGIIVQKEDINNIERVVAVNALFPHTLHRLCKKWGARLIHISTDCVFSGKKGEYKETDPADAQDVYGVSKYLGEVKAPGSITLRTSIIGEELGGAAHGLVGWFLSQTNRVQGWRKAIYSGVPTPTLARVIRDVVLPLPTLEGLYHISSEPIDKASLLALVGKAYGLSTEIEVVDGKAADKSLDSQLFRDATGFVLPNWPELIAEMRQASTRFTNKEI